MTRPRLRASARSAATGAIAACCWFLSVLCCASSEVATRSCDATGAVALQQNGTLEPYLKAWAEAQNATVLSLESSSCANESKPNAKAQLFSFCSSLEMSSRCLGTPFVTVYPQCKGDECEIIFSYDVLQCFSRERGTGFVEEAGSTPAAVCQFLEENPRYQKFRQVDWLFPLPGKDGEPCLTPWPRGTVISSILECVEGIPHSRVVLDLGTTISEDEFSCMLAGNCRSMSDGFYWMCVSKIEGFKFPRYDCLGFQDHASGDSDPEGVLSADDGSTMETDGVASGRWSLPQMLASFVVFAWLLCCDCP